MAGGAVRNVGHGGGVHGLRRGAACAACLMRGSALATHGGSIDELVQPQGVTADTYRAHTMPEIHINARNTVSKYEP